MDKNLGLIALISALSISSVAIFFSVAGLATIFSAYAISIIIMGTSIEVGKLVAVAWLHHNWNDKIPVLKAGLSFFVVGVMFITSTGIFGYLSKSHVEQTALSKEGVAQIKRVHTEVSRHKAIITRSEEKIVKYEKGGSGVDVAINMQIDRERARIDSAYNRVRPVIKEQLIIISGEEKKNSATIKLYRDEINVINADLKAVEDALRGGKIKRTQRLIGTDDDGSYGEDTIIALQVYRNKKQSRRNQLQTKINKIRSEPNIVIRDTRLEIKRIRKSAQQEINESNITIKKLRGRLGKQNQGDLETLILSEQKKIKESNKELDRLTQEKYKLEVSYRKMVAEVGPIKYIAEFVYGTKADAGILEKAVQWLIVILIFVFDPFAVFLLIAAQHSFEKHWKTHKKSKDLLIPKTEPDFSADEEAEPETQETEKAGEIGDIEADKPSGVLPNESHEGEMSASAMSYSDGMKNRDYKSVDHHGQAEAVIGEINEGPSGHKKPLGNPLRFKRLLGEPVGRDPGEKMK